jgi:hypothetical protein
MRRFIIAVALLAAIGGTAAAVCAAAAPAFACGNSDGC